MDEETRWNVLMRESHFVDGSWDVGASWRFDYHLGGLWSHIAVDMWAWNEAHR